MNVFSTWIKAHKVLFVVIVLVIAGGGYKLYPKAPISPYETAAVAKADLVQEVTVTGKVQSESSIDLAFERSGKIVEVGALVGDHVKRGGTLLRIDGSDVAASLAQAVANVQFEEASLAKLKKGARPEDIQVSQIALDNAKASLVDAASALRQSITDGYTKMDDSVRNKTDVLFRNPRTTNPELNIPVTDFGLSVDIVEMRKKAEAELIAYNTKLSTLSIDELSGLVVSVKTYLTDTKAYLDKLALAVNGLQPTSALSQLTIDGWKADISLARTNIAAATSGLIGSETAWRGADSSVALAAQQLALKQSGATAEELAQEEAKIASAKASIESYRAQLAKFTLSAPFDGVVTRQDGKRGAIASANLTLVSVQSEGAFKIEANIPEVDIAKIAKDDVAHITLDAYGTDAVFQGSVALVDPAERVIDGIPTYKVTLRFTDTESKVRSGMTANVVIETDHATQVLAIPARAITDKDGKRTVRVLTPTDTVEVREVTTGLRASDGRIAILSGLSEGEKVITFDKNASL